VLGHILVTQKVITRTQLLSVLDRHRRRSKLGELLVKSKAITPGQLEMALTEQRRLKQTLGEVVVRLKLVTEEQMRRALCQQLHINFFDLDSIVLDRALRALINPRFARKRSSCRSRVWARRWSSRWTTRRGRRHRRPQGQHGLDIEVITSATAAIRRALDQMYPATEASGAAEPALAAVGHQVPTIVGEPNILSFEEIDRLTEEKLTYVDVHHAAEGTASMVRPDLRLAIEWGASDIHLEAVEHGIQTRFRIDGVLQELDLGDLDEMLTQNRGKLPVAAQDPEQARHRERRRPRTEARRAPGA